MIPFGQLYGVDLGHGLWGAVQVVTSTPEFTRFAALAWFGKRKPTVRQLRAKPLLVHDHHSWKPASLVLKVAHGEPLPAWLVAVGASPSPVELGDGERRGAHFLLQLELQQRWLRAPAKARRAYHQALAEGGATKLQVAGDQDWRELDALSALSELAYEGDDLGLVGYLETRPLISGLGWKSATITSLDLRGTHVTRVTVQMPKLELLCLPDSCEALFLPACHPMAVEAAGLREVTFTHPAAPLSAVTGLAGASKLDVSWAEALDCNELRAFPELDKLVLHEVASLRSVELFAELKRLRHLEITSCFDFDAEAMPVPAQWPAMAYLGIDGLRKTAATALKRRAGKDKRLRLRAARSDLWLKTDLGNPFRDWDQHHPVATAKAAKRAYTVAAKAIAAEPHRLAEILRVLVEAFNAMEIDTVDREEIGEAFFDLVAQGDGDADSYAELFDTWRDF